MIKVFEIILCMYLKTISPDVPRLQEKKKKKKKKSEQITI
jgi:hypothetical protein